MNRILRLDTTPTITGPIARPRANVYCKGPGSYDRLFCMSFSHHGKAVARTLSCIAVWASTLIAQPLNERVLVVYNAANADSTAVAEYYRGARAIPQANLCATNPPSIVVLTEAQFNATLKPQIRACLDNVGRQK